MGKLTIEFDTIGSLRDQLAQAGAFFAAMPAEYSVAPSAEEPESLALYSDDELQVELKRRQPIAKPSQGEAQVTHSSEAPSPVITEKRKPGRPRKKQVEQPELPFNGEDKSDPPALPKVPREPETAAESMAPDLPTEDQVLGLMSEVYSVSGDMELVRSIMSDIGGKTQLSQIPPALWPELMKRLLHEQARLNENKRMSS